MTHPQDQALPGGESRLGVLIRQLQGRVPERVTALPAAPFDGQEIYYAADATNGVLWHLRYNAGSASAYKWEFVGGGELFAVNDSDGFAPTTYGDAGPAGPMISVPLAGDYLVAFGGLIYSNIGAVNGFMGIGINSSTAITGKAVTHANFGAGYTDYGDRSRQARYTGLAAGAVLKALYMSNPGVGVGFQQRWMRVTPVRVG